MQIIIVVRNIHDIMLFMRLNCRILHILKLALPRANFQNCLAVVLFTINSRLVVVCQFKYSNCWGIIAMLECNYCPWLQPVVWSFVYLLFGFHWWFALRLHNYALVLNFNLYYKSYIIIGAKHDSCYRCRLYIVYTYRFHCIILTII